MKCVMGVIKFCKGVQSGLGLGRFVVGGFERLQFDISLRVWTLRLRVFLGCQMSEAGLEHSDYD